MTTKEKMWLVKPTQAIEMHELPISVNHFRPGKEG